MKKQSKNHLDQLIGWYGVAAILVGYALISFRAISPQSYLYQGLVLTGSTGIIVVSLKKRDFQPVVLNVIFVSIAIISLILLIK